MPPPGPDQEPVGCSWRGCREPGDTALRDHTRADDVKIKFCDDHAAAWLARFPSRESAPAPDPAGLPDVSVCVACGTRFIGHRVKQMHCSVSCKNRAHRERQRATRERERGRERRRVCPWCEAAFTCSTGRKRYCSKRCVGLAWLERKRVTEDA